MMSWDKTPSISVYFEDKQVIEGKATAFTNAAIEAAIIHCRALLEFLGLGGKSQTQLKEIATRMKSDDATVEQFEGLSKVSIKKAAESYKGSADQAEASLAYVIYLANKGLAHTTTSFTRHDDGSTLLESAFRGVPALVVNNFYKGLKIPPPKYEWPTRKLETPKRGGP